MTEPHVCPVDLLIQGPKQALQSIRRREQDSHRNDPPPPPGPLLAPDRLITPTNMSMGGAQLEQVPEIGFLPVDYCLMQVSPQDVDMSAMIPLSGDCKSAASDSPPQTTDDVGGVRLICDGIDWDKVQAVAYKAPTVQDLAVDQDTLEFDVFAADTSLAHVGNRVPGRYENVHDTPQNGKRNVAQESKHAHRHKRQKN